MGHSVRTGSFCTEPLELVLDASQWRQERESAASHLDIWCLIRHLPIISDRVQAENFFGWAEKYIEYL